MTARLAMKPVRSSISIRPAVAGLALLLAVAGGCNSNPRQGSGSGNSEAAVIGPPGATITEVCLRADGYTLQAGAVGTGSPAIPMWGFVKTGTGAGCGFTGAAPTGTSAVVPTIDATAGSYLNVRLRNNLSAGPTAYTEPVSISIPGQTFFGSDGAGSPGPTWTDGSTGPRQSPSQRVRSFTVEAPLGSGGPGAVVTYAFGPLRPGTYLVRSGTHPGLQVQMGLVAALVVRPATAGRAYPDASSAFDRELTLVLSEIDPAFHAAVGAGQYGPNPNGADPPPDGWFTSPIDYHPKYFLVNGSPYKTSAAPASVPGNARVLLRLLNGGLDTKVPAVGGPNVDPVPDADTAQAKQDRARRYLSLIAEDGNFYSVSGKIPSGAAGSCPAPRVQNAVMLPAGGTVDALLTTPGAGKTVPVYDRRGNVSNAGAWPGGLLATLTTAGGAASPPGPAVGPCNLHGP